MTSLPGTVDYDTVADVIRRRRTCLQMDPARPVDVSVVDQLCELASWAPCHKRTWPWRFACFTGLGRARLGATMADDMVAVDFGDAQKREKTRHKYMRAPTVLVVATTPHDNNMLHVENRDAVAAGIQNLLLGATALGLSSFWSTPALTQPAGVLSLCGFTPEERIVGVIYLGWPDDYCPAPQRDDVAVTYINQ